MNGFDRRSFLLGLGGGGLAFALGGRALAQVAARAPKRLVLFMQNNGTQQANFWPGTTFMSPILEPLLQSPTLAAKTTVVKGIYMPSDMNGAQGNQHDVGFARLFTGAKLLSVGGKPWGGGASVDQLVAKAWGIDSLTLAVLSSKDEPQPKPGFEHRRSFSYVGPGKHKLPIVDPFLVYQALFPAGSTTPSTGQAGTLDPALKQRLLLRQSVLDSVAGDLAALQSRLGAQERAKIEIHTTAVRQAERRLSAQLSGTTSAPVAASCTPPAAPKNYTQTAPELLLNNEQDIPAMVTSMVDLAAAALICGRTRVASLQFGFGGGKWRFAWEGIDLNHHDDIAHKDTSDAGSSTQTTDRVVKINRFYATHVARLAQALDAVPEDGGTMLDNTLIVWGNELGRGSHTLENIPLVMIGGAGAGLRGGRVLDQGKQLFNRIGCSILNLMGQTSPGFGDSADCGLFSGLV